MNNTRQLALLAIGERTTGLWNAVRARPRTELAAVALIIVTIGVAMNWSALVAAGIAPLLISALPCAVMCALGLCMSRMGRNSSSTEIQQSTAATPAPVLLDSAAAPSHGPGRHADPASTVEGEPAAVDQLQQQERRPTHA